ncbi:hypothetical protein PanWU01x14_043790 [Parasponia andersonii]|uniref:F-box associated domain n=1 Tax=Parasponia andersonii TaxID=3476 RepID=A0A2P5DQ31_PARAD|nr:hypothetical protein PanWU01x14_043790 [Parasponia andersonii]
MGNTILSFDMSKEKFRSIPFPDLRLEKTINCFRILELWNESVVFFTSTQCSWFSTSFEMWVMVDNFGGVEGSTYWIKHLKIGPLVCICGPLAFWKEDELLLETRDGGVVSYNLYTRKIRKLPLCGATYSPRPKTRKATLCKHEDDLLEWERERKLWRSEEDAIQSSLRGPR